MKHAIQNIGIVLFKWKSITYTLKNATMNLMNVKEQGSNAITQGIIACSLL